MAGKTLEVVPIAYIRTEMTSKFDAPHQPDQSSAGRSVVELMPGRNFEAALEDLGGFEFIWLVFWFSKNSSWRPKVRPPRGEGIKRGVFATRSPHRPNPIGLSAVRLIEVRERSLVIGACDLIDGTPILDIKPYIPAIDAFPGVKAGWVDAIDEQPAKSPGFEVEMSEPAQRQVEWLEARDIRFMERAAATLARDPAPHRTRRIRRFGPELFRMGCAEWRVFFRVSGFRVLIERIEPGYPRAKLESSGAEIIRNREAQLKFFEAFPR